MKRHILLLSAVVVMLLSSCLKSYDIDKQNAKDDAEIQVYLTSNNIQATKDVTGVYYQIITPGGAEHPNGLSSITVDYVGSRLDGSIFDQNTKTTLTLGSVIAGWQIGLPKIGAGGEIKLFIPSSLAYGNQDAQGLKNTPLVFDIKLTSIN